MNRFNYFVSWVFDNTQLIWSVKLVSLTFDRYDLRDLRKKSGDANFNIRAEHLFAGGYTYSHSLSSERPHNSHARLSQCLHHVTDANSFTKKDSLISTQILSQKNTV